MATKSNSLFVNEGHQVNNVNQFTNLNLNQNYVCSDPVFIQSNSKSSSDKVFDQKKKSSHSWKKSMNDSLCSKPLYDLNLCDKNEEKTKKPWINDSISNTNSSTLSLHISAYENFIDEIPNKSEEESSIKSKVLHSLEQLKVPFEYPRQMNCSNTGIPEIMQFKASQRLISPNQSIPSPRAYPMQTIAFTNVTLIDESKESSGRPLWLSLVNRASKLGFNTRILLFIELEKDLSALFVNGQCVNYVDCLRTCKTLPELTEMLHSNANEIGNQKALLVIDNLTLLARRFGIDSIAALLFSVGQICPVLSRFQHNPFSDIEQNRLKSIATTILSLSKSAENGKQICKTITLKKGGLGIREKMESYEISPETAEITSRSIETGTKKAAGLKATSDFMPCHGGGTSSSSSSSSSAAAASRERAQREKASVVLPFTRAQTEKGLVGLNANRKKPAGAKIEYFAEKCDDLEDSDPDEELMY